RAAMSNASKRLTHDAADELVGVQEHPVPEAAAEVARAGHARWDAPAAHIGKEVVDLSALRHLLIALTPLLEALEGVFSVGRRVPVLLLIGTPSRVSYDLTSATSFRQSTTYQGISEFQQSTRLHRTLQQLVSSADDGTIEAGYHREAAGSASLAGGHQECERGWRPSRVRARCPKLGVTMNDEEKRRRQKERRKEQQRKRRKANKSNDESR
ncbi:hypothetical protein THAOC_15121, partial [Thalassiosira oceanica]